MTLYFTTKAGAEAVAKQIQSARGVLIKRGLCKGSLRGKDGTVCALGAIYVACGTTWENSDPALALSEFLAVTGINDSGYVARWNDAEGRTVDDIAETFDALASLALSEAEVLP